MVYGDIWSEGELTPRRWIIVGWAAVLISLPGMALLCLLGGVMVESFVASCCRFHGAAPWGFFVFIAAWFAPLAGLVGLIRALMLEQFGWVWRGVALLLALVSVLSVWPLANALML